MKSRSSVGRSKSGGMRRSGGSGLSRGTPSRSSSTSRSRGASSSSGRSSSGGFSFRSTGSSYRRPFFSGGSRGMNRTGGSTTLFFAGLAIIAVIIILFLVLR